MTPLLVALFSFASVAIIIFVTGHYIVNQAAIRRRLPMTASTSQNTNQTENIARGLLASLVGKVDEKKFGIEGILRGKLRRELIRAGYFSEDAIRFYVIARIGLVLILPTFVYIFSQALLSQSSFYVTLILVSVTALISILGVDAFISRRQKSLQQEYRIVFPDLVDMLVVCIDAGLSLDVAFSRIYPEVSKRSRGLGMNLAILGTETRAGRGMADALDGFADRLNLDEATAFVLMLRQSLVLGTDIGETLRVFSDEMRRKRLLRAEETANKLPVKMVIPVGLFIFPVILMVIMVPVMIKLLSVMKIVG
jgi:tight adherence protein C